MKSLIGGEWRDAKDGKVIEVINPATGELVDNTNYFTTDFIEVETNENYVFSNNLNIIVNA